ncbi:sugar O-acetyltransferase [Enterococcus sp. LJL120]
MENQFERMIAGELYLARDSELSAKFTRCQKLLDEYNRLTYEQKERRTEIRRELLGTSGEHVTLVAPFRCDYGENISIGENFYANYDCIMLDVAPIEIGDNVMFGPRVGLYTAGHPIDAAVRNTGLEFGNKIKIGDNVWIGGNTVVNPGVTIGNNVVIGSGSVVTKDIPADVIALGNPCRVLRPISPAESLAWQERQAAYEKEFKISL